MLSNNRKLAIIILALFLFILILVPASATTVTLQPNATEGKDAWLRKGFPNKNYGAGIILSIRPGNNRNALIEFNLSNIPSNAEITSANLSLYATSVGGGPNQTADIHRITQSWVEGTGAGTITNDGATWNKYDGVNSWTTNGGDYDSKVWANTTIPSNSANVWYTWNVTDLVQSWVNGTYSDYGLLVRTTTANSRITRFASSDNGNSNIHPKLIVEYVDNSPNVTLSSPANGSNTSDSTPDFTFTATDDYSATLSCTLYIDGAAKGTNNSVANGTSTTITASGLSDGLLSWYVNCTDSESNVGQSESRQIRIDTSAPLVTIDSPNQNDVLGWTVSLQNTISDSGVGIDSVWYTIKNVTAVNGTGANVSGNLSASDYDEYWVTDNTTGDGDYNYTVCANDTLGNQDCKSVVFTLDNTNPSIQLVYPNGHNISQNFNLDLRVSNEHLTNTTYSIKNSTGSIMQSGEDNSLAGNYTLYIWDNLVNISTWADGVYNVTAWGKDLANNENSASATFIIDKTVPTYSNLERTADPIYNDMSVQLNVTWIDANGIETVYIRHNATGSWQNVTASKSGNVYSITIDSSDLQNQEVVGWNSYAKDSAGNWNTSMSVQSFTVQNRAPSVASASIVPSPAYEADALGCNNGTVSDPDGDAVTFYYKWFVNALEVNETSQNLGNSYFAHFNNITCQIIPNDGLVNGSAVNSSILTISNTAPELTNPTVDSVAPGTKDIVSCLEGNYTDDDGDSQTASYWKWYKNGAEQTGQSAQNLSLPDISADVGDNITCAQATSDGYDNSTWYNSSNSAIAQDDIEPSYSNLTEPTDPSTYSPGANYTFNATWTDNVAVDTVLFEFDGTNYTANNLGSNYYYTVSDLAVGTYNYKWWANDTLDNWNNTGLLTFTINKASSSVNLLLNSVDGNLTVQPSQSVNATATSNPAGYVEIYKDGQLLASGNSPVTNTSTYSSSGTYNITAVYSATANYTASSETHWLIVDSPPQVVSFGADEENPEPGENVLFSSQWTDDVNLSAFIFSWTADGPNCDQWLNGTPGNFSAGGWGSVTIAIPTSCEGKLVSYKFYANDTADNWNATGVKNVSVKNVYPQYSNLTEPTDPSTYSLGANYTFGATWTDNTNVSTVYFEFEGTNYTANNSGNDYSYVVSDLAAGNYSYRWWANDTLDNWNYTNLLSFTVSKASSTTTLLLNDVDNSITINVTDSVNISANCTPASSVEIYKNASLIANGTSPIWNVSTFNLPGDYNITANCAELQNYSSSSKTWLITVNDNIDPVINSVVDNPDPVDPGQTVNISANVTDNIGVDSVWIDIDGSNNSMSYLGGNDWSYNSFDTARAAGNYNYTIHANDTSGNDATPQSGSFVINNLAPEINSFEPSNVSPSVAENSTLEFNASATDANQDSLSYTWYLDSNSVGSNSDYTYEPDFDAAGTHNITVVVSDGVLEDSQTWNVTVTNVNRAPSISSFSPINTNPSIPENSSQEFNVTASDPDNDSISYSWYLDGANISNSTSYVYSTDFDDSGIHNISVVVSDGNLEDSQTWTVNVTNVNRLPQLSNASIDSPNLPSWVELGDYVNLSATVTDPDNDIASVWFEINDVNYTYQSNSGDVYWYAFSSYTNLGVNSWQAWANDSYNVLVNSTEQNFTVLDTIRAAISNLNAPTLVDKNQTVNISADVVDKGLSKVEVEITWPNSTNEKFDMININGTDSWYYLFNQTAQAGVYRAEVIATETAGYETTDIVKFRVNAVCGDGECEAGESCSSCSEDCGSCSGSGSGSGGGTYLPPTLAEENITNITNVTNVTESVIEEVIGPEEIVAIPSERVSKGLEAITGAAVALGGALSDNYLYTVVVFAIMLTIGALYIYLRTPRVPKQTEQKRPDKRVKKRRQKTR